MLKHRSRCRPFILHTCSSCSGGERSPVSTPDNVHLYPSRSPPPLEIERSSMLMLSTAHVVCVGMIHSNVPPIMSLMTRLEHSRRHIPVFKVSSHHDDAWVIMNPISIDHVTVHFSHGFVDKFGIDSHWSERLNVPFYPMPNFQCS